ncbi:MAG: flippase [Candidatus Komeilibacteria bacterium]
MSTAAKIFSNTAWQIGLRLVELVIGVFTLALITRYLGQTQYGYYTTIMAWLQLVSIVIDFGLYLTLLRELAAKPENEQHSILNNVFTLRLISALIFFACGVFIIQFLPYPQIIKNGVIALSFSFFFVSLVTVLTAVFQKKLAMPKVAVSSLASKVLLLILIYLGIRQQVSLQTLMYLSSAASFFFFILIWFWINKYHSLKLSWDWHYWLTILVKTWPLAVTTALNLIYFKIDTVFLSLYQPASDVGLYGASYRVLEITTTFPHMFMGLLLPLLTAAWIATDYQRFYRIWQKAFDIFALLTFPLVAGTLIVSTPLMTLVAGKAFAASGPILNILIVATAIIFFGTLGTYVVLTLEKQKQMVKYFLLAAILAVIGYWWLIPIYSYWAAAWVTLVVEALIVVFAWLTIRRQWHYRPSFTVAGKALLASIIMALVVNGLYFLPLPVQILIGIIIYGCGLIVTKAFSWSEIKSLVFPQA